MNITLITGNEPRHAFFLNNTLHAIEKVEKCRYQIIIEPKLRPQNKLSFVKESKYFHPTIKINRPMEITLCNHGEINSKLIVNTINEFKPEIMFIFGCSLLKRDVFDIPNKKCINIHTGLVQYFRGTNSHFWAIMDEKPYGIGATVHYVDKSIDAGFPIVQERPEININDKFDDLFFKSCECGFNVLAKNIKHILYGNINERKLDSWGKIYNSKDLLKEKYVDGNKKIKTVLSNYLKNKENVDKNHPLINNIGEK